MRKRRSRKLFRKNLKIVLYEISLLQIALFSWVFYVFLECYVLVEKERPFMRIFCNSIHDPPPKAHKKNIFHQIVADLVHLIDLFKGILSDYMLKRPPE